MRSITCMTIIGLQFTCGMSLAGDVIAKATNLTAADIRRNALTQEKQVLGALARRITIEAHDAPVTEVVQRISQLIDHEIFLDSPALADAGISIDQSVDFNLGEMTTSQALHFILKPLQLTWTVNDGILEITATEKAKELMVTRVYDVRHLSSLLEPLSRDLPWRNQTPRDVNNLGGMMGGGIGESNGGGSMGGGAVGTHGGGGLFSIPALAVHTGAFGQFSGMGGGMLAPASTVRADSVPMSLRSVESLLASVISQFPGLNWMDNDGEGGVIEASAGVLIVTQNYHAQALISSFLKTLEKMLEDKTSGLSLAIHRQGYPAEEDSSIFAALMKPKDLEIHDEELDEALAHIAENAGFPLWIDKWPLADYGISTDQAVTLEIRNQPLGVGLKKILAPLPLAYVIEEGVVVITSKEKASDTLTLRLYDITNCGSLESTASQKGLVSILKKASQGKWESEDGEGGFASLISTQHLLVAQNQAVHAEIELILASLRIDDPADREPELLLRVYSTPDLATASDLIEILPQLVGSSWSEEGSIHRAGRSLLITQPTSVHDKLEAIIKILHQSQSRSPSVSTSPAAAVRPPEPDKSSDD